MKKILFCLVLTCTTVGTTTMMQSCSSPMALNAGNVSSIVSKIVTLLGSKLGLSGSQSPLISKLLTTFLGNKLNLGSLMKTNPTQYASQFGDIQGKLMEGLGGVLQGNQMSKLMALKPTANDAKNVLSQLFY
jgi:hypothetical protein